MITWPPEKPTSTRRSSPASRAMSVSSLGRLDQLGEHTAGRGGVHERHEAVADAVPGLLVDHAQPARAALLDRARNVGATVSRVMEARPLLGKELSDRGLVPERRQQLD